MLFDVKILFITSLIFSDMFSEIVISKYADTFLLSIQNTLFHNINLFLLTDFKFKTISKEQFK